MLALSATYPESLAQHLCRYMREPTFVRLNPTDPGLLGEAVPPPCLLFNGLMLFFKRKPNEQAMTLGCVSHPSLPL